MNTKIQMLSDYSATMQIVERNGQFDREVHYDCV